MKNTPQQAPDHATALAPRDDLMALLSEIHTQNTQMLAKVEVIEQDMNKRAVLSGAIAGALSGGIGGTVITVGVELIKAKFGG